MPRHRPADTAGPLGAHAATWRSASEVWAAAAWCLPLAWTLPSVAAGTAGAPESLVFTASAGFLMLRAAQTFSVWRSRARLAGRSMEFLSRREFARLFRNRAGRDRIWFGRGFEWTPECAQKAYELTKADLRQLLPPRPFLRLLAGHAVKDPEAIGLGAIHGVGAQEHDLLTAEKTLEGGTLLVGTTQSGKGVMLSVLVTQSVLRGDAVLVIDPKNSKRLMSAVRESCRLAGRPEPLLFHPGRAESVPLNPLGSFGRTTEIASRVTAEMPSGNAFSDFAWHAVEAAAEILVELGETPTLERLREATNRGLMHLALDLVARQMGRDAFEAILEDAPSGARSDPRFVLRLLEQLRRDSAWTPALQAAEDICQRTPEYHAKVTASLLPVLTRLTAGVLRETLSPAPGRGVTLQGVLECGGVLYVALDSLPDPVVGSALGTMLLADLASLAGARYNRGAPARRIALFVDECSNVISRSLIEILNKGAESGIRTTCAMQTVADLAARLGSDSAARMALGNFNNVIALRTRDRATQEFAAESFGATWIERQEAALSTSSDSSDAGEFRASCTRRFAASREEVVPPDLLGRLPNAEFFASLAGGRLVKGRVPVLVGDDS